MGFIGIIIAIVLGAAVGVAGSVGLVNSQGGTYPTQNQGSITVYGSNG